MIGCLPMDYKLGYESYRMMKYKLKLNTNKT